jgi:hypothetical protein
MPPQLKFKSATASSNALSQYLEDNSHLAPNQLPLSLHSVLQLPDQRCATLLHVAVETVKRLLETLDGFEDIAVRKKHCKTITSIITELVSNHQLGDIIIDNNGTSLIKSQSNSIILHRNNTCHVLADSLLDHQMDQNDHNGHGSPADANNTEYTELEMFAIGIHEIVTGYKNINPDPPSLFTLLGRDIPLTVEQSSTTDMVQQLETEISHAASADNNHIGAIRMYRAYILNSTLRKSHQKSVIFQLLRLTTKNQKRSYAEIITRGTKISLVVDIYGTHALAAPRMPWSKIYKLTSEHFSTFIGYLDRENYMA